MLLVDYGARPDFSNVRQGKFCSLIEQLNDFAVLGVDLRIRFQSIFAERYYNQRLVPIAQLGVVECR